MLLSQMIASTARNASSASASSRSASSKAAAASASTPDASSEDDIAACASPNIESENLPAASPGSTSSLDLQGGWGWGAAGTRDWKRSIIHEHEHECADNVYVGAGLHRRAHLAARASEPAESARASASPASSSARWRAASASAQAASAASTAASASTSSRRAHAKLAAADFARLAPAPPAWTARSAALTARRCNEPWSARRQKRNRMINHALQFEKLFDVASSF